MRYLVFFMPFLRLLRAKTYCFFGCFGHCLEETKKDLQCIEKCSNFAVSKSFFMHMKKRIIYVGTLIDLAMLFEPDMDEESEELSINIKNNKVYE